MLLEEGVEVEAEVADVGSSLGADDEVVGPVATVLRNVGVARHRPIDRSTQHLVVRHRDDQERVVGEPAETRGLTGHLDEELLVGAVGLDREDAVTIEVREEQPSLVPARGLAEGQPLLDDGGSVLDGHGPSPVVVP